jgi:hypothetical protein
MAWRKMLAVDRDPAIYLLIKHFLHFFSLTNFINYGRVAFYNPEVFSLLFCESLGRVLWRKSAQK